MAQAMVYTIIWALLFCLGFAGVDGQWVLALVFLHVAYL